MNTDLIETLREDAKEVETTATEASSETDTAAYNGKAAGIRYAIREIERAELNN